MIEQKITSSEIQLVMDVERGQRVYIEMFSSEKGGRGYLVFIKRFFLLLPLVF